MKTQIGIIGAGPAGLTLALLLHKAGIDCVILENRSRDYIEARVRAGLLEHNTVEIFDQLGVSDRLHKDGLIHHGCYISYNGIQQHIDFAKHTQREVTIYGQQEIVKDIINACLDRNIPIHFEADVTAIKDITTLHPQLIFSHGGEIKTLACEYVAGTDGFHGISRKTLPIGSYNEYKIEYPFSWLGILAYSQPTYKELIYAYHDNGFALASMRSEKVSRLYLQVPNGEKLDEWDDDKIWKELEHRLGIELERGEIFEKSITPMRSFMIDHLQYGRLYLAGDSGHIVPPTGAKGLNLAVADVRNLAQGLIAHYQKNDNTGLENYSKKCIARVWRVQDFSNFMTQLCHKMGDSDTYDQLLQKSKFDYLRISDAYQKTIAENYVGLPFELFD